MSYRTVKRLLGETSLERKCHLLFATFSILLITGSFYFYARQTEHLAYEQLNTACRLLVGQIVDQQLATGCRQVIDGQPTPRLKDEVGPAVHKEFHDEWEKPWPEPLRDYLVSWLKPGPGRPGEVLDQVSQAKLKLFQDDPEKREDHQLQLSQ